MRVFAKFDDTNKKNQNKVVKEINPKVAKQVNQKGYGIFFTPNPCEGRLLTQNVVSIDWWFVDIDEGEKKDILNKIKSSPLYPTIIVETKRGYHAYWKAKNGTKENFRRIEQGLIDYFGGDNAVKNPNRLMRCPNFYHMKDPNNPFLVRILEYNTKEYDEKIMDLTFAPIKVKIKNKKKFIKKEVNKDILSNDQKIINTFCIFGDITQMGDNSGRRNYLLRVIGIIKFHYKNITLDERYKIIKIINNNFAVPLDIDEVNVVFKTTVEDRDGF